MNAYGRVPHNLILFALHHYHFPEWFVKYLHQYHDELLVRRYIDDWAGQFKGTTGQFATWFKKVNDRIAPMGLEIDEYVNMIRTTLEDLLIRSDKAPLNRIMKC